MWKMPSLLAHLNLIKNPIFYQKQFDRKSTGHSISSTVRLFQILNHKKVSGQYFQNKGLAIEQDKSSQLHFFIPAEADAFEKYSTTEENLSLITVS